MADAPKAVRPGLLSAASCAGMLVFGIVMALLGAVLPHLSARLDFDLAQAGQLFLAMNLCMLLCSLWIGPAMDHTGMKPPMALGALAVGGALMIFAFASGFRGLLGAAVLLGAGGGALNASTNTLIADLNPESRRKSAALNLLGVFFGFGALLLPFGIGSLVNRLGLVTILSLAAILCAVTSLFSVSLRFPAPKQSAGMRASDTARFLRVPMVWGLALLLFCESGNEFLLGGYISTYLTREIHLSIPDASYILAGFWAAIMLARLLSSRVLLRIPGRRVILLGAAVAFLCSLVLVVAGAALPAAAAAVALGFSLAGIYPTTLGLAAAKFEQHSGTVFGILFTIALAGGMLFPWVAGQIGNASGMRAGLALAPAAFAAIFLIASALPTLAVLE